MTNLFNYALYGAGVLGIFVVLLVLYVLGLRRIVRPDQVHVVQRNNTSDVYGSSARDNKGNTYYEFPEWIPRLGVTVKKLPTAIFDVNLTEYDAYDKDRLPFLVDIKAFFRIFDFRVAASKVRDTKELEDQLKGIVQGAVRSLLAKEDLESIMSERAKYGKQFTQEVEEQLKEWGVVAVKNIELMDIKDSHNSEVIANIMKKKKSAIEMESRTTVANNMKQAKEAEIVANQAVALKEQDSVREVGLRQAQVQQEVGIANEQQMQKVQEQAKITAEKEMEVQRVREVKSAEITKQAAEVKAAQDKEVATINAETAVVKTEADKKVKVLNAEAEKQQVMLHAEANKEQITLKAAADLVTATNEAKGIEAKGKAQAQATELAKKASVQDQVTLAKEVGENEPYQNFLIKQKQVEVQGDVMKAVGVAQAQNLSGADVKIFANAGTVSEGVGKAAGIFNPGTAFDIASMIEAFKSTPMGSELLDKFLGTGDAVKTIETVRQVTENTKANRNAVKAKSVLRKDED